MTSHPDLDALGLDLVEGTLAPEETSNVEAHVSTCAACQSKLRTLVAAHRASLAAVGRPAGADVSGQSGGLRPDPAKPLPPARRAALVDAGLLVPAPDDEQVTPDVEGQLLREVAAIADGSVRPAGLRKPTAEEAAALRDGTPPEAPDVEGQSAVDVPCPWCHRPVPRPWTFTWLRCPHCEKVVVAR
jgi:hypothetical protein